jgi:hypothetical protein
MTMAHATSNSIVRCDLIKAAVAPLIAPLLEPVRMGAAPALPAAAASRIVDATSDWPGVSALHH